jgi:protein-disulfide isomerase
MRIAFSPDRLFAAGMIAVIATAAYRQLGHPESRPIQASYVPSARNYIVPGNRIGRSDARHVIVEFSDFQCPFCATERVELEAAVAASPGQIAILFRHLPLTGIHPFAYAAAEASECAGEQDRFTEYHDALYSNQAAIGRAPWDSIAVLAGVRNTEAFSECVRSHRGRARVERDIGAARELRINGTPTLLIGDSLVKGGANRTTILKMVRALK